MQCGVPNGSLGSVSRCCLIPGILLYSRFPCRTPLQARWGRTRRQAGSLASAEPTDVRAWCAHLDPSQVKSSLAWALDPLHDECSAFVQASKCKADHRSWTAALRPSASAIQLRACHSFAPAVA